MTACAKLSVPRHGSKLPGLRLLKASERLELADEGAPVRGHSPQDEIIDRGTIRHRLERDQAADTERDDRDSRRAPAS